MKRAWVCLASLLMACSKPTSDDAVATRPAPTKARRQPASSVAPKSSLPPPATTATASAPKPVTSPDGQLEVFLKDEGREEVTVSPGETISIADLRVVVRHRDTGEEVEIGRNDEREGCLSLANPRFAFAEAVLVESHGFGAPTIHNFSICAVDVAERKIHLLARRTRCALPITAGRYRGSFFVNGADFRVGSGLVDAPRIVSRKGAVARKLSENPFVRDWNGDGFVTGDELQPECDEAPRHLAELEQVMEKL